MEATASTERPVTDAALATGVWVVGERYVVRDAVDHIEISAGAWLPLQGTTTWRERDAHGRRREIRRDERALRGGERWVRLIVDESPDPRSRSPSVWAPGQRPGLVDELVALGQRAEAAIVAWVAEHGFVGVRHDRWERAESVEEIRYALACLGQARDLVGAIRRLKGDELRAEVERLSSLPPGLLADMNADPRQPMAGGRLAREFGIAVPAGEEWPGAGAYIQALYALSSVLQAPLERFLRVQATIAPTGDGLRLQGAIVAEGPLATAYLQTLDEASWPALTYAGSMLRIDWRAPRRCGRCARTFRPSRRDQKWCGERCRWAASKAGHG